MEARGNEPTTGDGSTNSDGWPQSLIVLGMIWSVVTVIASVSLMILYRVNVRNKKTYRDGHLVVLLLNGGFRALWWGLSFVSWEGVASVETFKKILNQLALTVIVLAETIYTEQTYKHQCQSYQLPRQRWVMAIFFGFAVLLCVLVTVLSIVTMFAKGHPDQFYVVFIITGCQLFVLGMYVFCGIRVMIYRHAMVACGRVLLVFLAVGLVYLCVAVFWFVQGLVDDLPGSVEAFLYLAPDIVVCWILFAAVYVEYKNYCKAKLQQEEYELLGNSLETRVPSEMLYSQ